ncbi:helix-turn-helix domain-containing protein [Saccharomonospora azurea]
MSGINPDALAYVLGGEIRAHREAARLVQRELARRVGVSHSMVVRWERGIRVPDAAHLVKFADVLGLSAVDRDRLTQLAREAADEPVNEVSAGERGQADALTTLIEFERSATAITDVSPLLVPGLMQTSDYARIVLGRAADVETRTAVRVGRRDVLTRRRNPVQYTAMILESVLHQRIGSEVMADQLRLICTLADLPNVCVRIIPDAVGLTRAHMGAFMLIEFAKAEPIVHLEHLSTTAFLRDRADVEAHMGARTDLDQVAMSPDDSIELIADVIEKMETTQ